MAPRQGMGSSVKFCVDLMMEMVVRMLVAGRWRSSRR